MGPLLTDPKVHLEDTHVQNSACADRYELHTDFCDTQNSVGTQAGLQVQITIVQKLYRQKPFVTINIYCLFFL